MACKPGFYGLLCNNLCPPGAFGKKCGGVCSNCSVDDCDNVYGCVKTIGKTHEGKVNGVIDNHKPHKSENASSINIPSTAKNNELLDRSTFSTSYLLLGLIGVLCLLLFALIVYICKKFTTSKRENSNCVRPVEKHSHDGRQIHDQQSDKQSYKSVSVSAKTEQVYRPLDSKYEEIDEKLLIKNYRLSQTSSDDYVQPTVSSEHLLHTHGITDSDFPMKDVRVEQSLESSLSVNTFNPIILEINPCDIKDKNAYLDIIE